ncbi:hypothetical protein BS47DRAFT_648674 [Hydnum rufescens UP504]|uniref:SAGA-associated factor 11 n=1 Tax=Hydnum rufescens UP504 TaxID=1448309 RepID=A0A9P6BD82_9AGAM|nr:hypothetical protein BS47DRAFT_648674 [Hydnum rufescens UP504]
MGEAVRSDVISALTKIIFDAMVDEGVSEIIFEAHKSIARARQPCSICHAHCQSAHVSTSLITTAPKAPEPLQLPRPDTPLIGQQKSPAANAASAKSDVLLTCLNCSRPMASSRYAQHLSSCMGLGNSRRGAIRNTASKLTLESEIGSPYLESESESAKGKGKALADPKTQSKGKKRVNMALDPKTKSPSPKKHKVSPIKMRPQEHFVPLPVKGTGPPRRPAYVPLHAPNGQYPLGRPTSQTSVPSRLRASSVASSSSVSQESGGARTPTPSFSTSTTSSSSAPHSQQAAHTHAPYRELYPTKPLVYPSGNWVKSTDMIMNPPHVDADEVVDTDSSDVDSS